MSNQMRGEATIELGGLPIQLKFDFNTLAEMEGLLGVSMLKVAQDFENHVGLRFLRAAVLAGSRKDPNARGMTLDKAGALLATCDFVSVSTAITEAFAGAFGGLQGQRDTTKEAAAPAGPLESPPTTQTGEA